VSRAWHAGPVRRDRTGGRRMAAGPAGRIAEGRAGRTMAAWAFR
jgi:hypothetical protein